MTKARQNTIPARTQSKEPCYFWVDQICIDQSVLEERNHQVQMMARIFNQAKEVVVWLGASNEAGFVRAVELMLEDSEDEEFDWSTLLAVVFDRDYWSRLWLLQEFVLARKLLVLCGSTCYEEDVLKDIWRVSKRYEVYTSAVHIIEVRHHVAERLAIGQTGISIRTIMPKIGVLKCLDPGDMIYGLLGIAEEAPDIVVNYSLSAAEVFWRAVVHMHFADEGLLAKVDAYEICRLGVMMGFTGREPFVLMESLPRTWEMTFGEQTPEQVFDFAHQGLWDHIEVTKSMDWWAF
jgi:hypothetical protein